jgi:hypothetical protein
MKNDTHRAFRGLITGVLISALTWAVILLTVFFFGS